MKFTLNIDDDYLAPDLMAQLDSLRADLYKQPLPLMAALAPQNDDEIKTLAAHLQKFSHIVICGTGGASLGGQTLTGLYKWAMPETGHNAPQLYFLDNLSPLSLDAVLNEARLADTGFLVISKSGETMETLMQTSCILAALKEAKLPAKAHLFIITQSTPASHLGRIGEHYGLTRIAHPPDIGGRFSAFTAPALVPALLVGLEMNALREGAAKTLDDFFAHKGADNMALIGAACHYYMAKQKRNIAVLMAYDDRLDKFGAWWRQLWAESLGKKGGGTMPAFALGTLDQHSQMQLYLDGADDKFYTLIQTDAHHPMRGVEHISGAEDLSWLHNCTVQDMVLAEAQASLDALIKQKRPTRLIEAGTLTEHTFGELLFYFMLETICTAHALGVNPFDQPAIEDGKHHARAILQKNLPQS